MMKKFAAVGIFLALIGCALGCVPSITRVTGTHAPGGQLCSGQLLFEDNFNGIDTSKWFSQTRWLEVATGSSSGIPDKIL